MKRNIESLIGFKMGAIDGEIGKIEEFYFDDHTWIIRYLVVNTGNWLSGRKVLIAPEAVEKANWKHKVLPVSLTKQQIENSPDVDTDKPVSRQQEIKLYEHYPWKPYWGAGLWPGGIINPGIPMPTSPSPEETKQKEHSPHNEESTDDPNLRSTAKVKGYNIKAIDGEIGDVQDYILDDTTWKIHFIIVDTGNWFPGKKVLISPTWIKKINWVDSSVIIKATMEHVKNSPEYVPGQEVSDSYEANLQNYYGRFIS